VTRPVPDTVRQLPQARGSMPGQLEPARPSEALRLPVEVPDDRDPERTKEHVSTVLSTVAILAIVVGLTWGLWPHIGPWSLCAGGVALAVLVTIADSARKPDALPAVEPDPEPVTKPLVPGPTDAGNLHAKGPGASA